MTQWERTTPWRQGHLLTDAALRALFDDVDDLGAIGVVVSHSCDLAQPPSVEPSVEVIIGRTVPAPDGNFSHAKNARTLHMMVETQHGGAVHLELRAPSKTTVGKDRLANFLPDGGRTLPPGERDVLQRWLAARYRRSAFPDEFDHRLSDANIPGKLAKMLAPLGRDIVCLFFDIDEGRETERSGENDTYLLSIFVLYTDQNNENAAKIAETAAKNIRRLLESKFWDATKQTWKWIELDLIECFSTESLSYEASMRLRKWNADHISLRPDDKQPILD